MHQKSTSLPKIKQAKEEGEQKPKSHRKILKEFYKSRWSVAPKCLVEGHEGKDVLYVCINASCQQSTRFVCQICFFKNHQKHNQQFLAIDEIKLAEIDKLRFWPFDQKYRKIFQFITKHESYVQNMVQDVNATFNGMAIRIINSIDKIRLGLLKKIDNFYLKESKKKQFCDKVKFELQKCFDLKGIQQIVRQIFTKQIRHDIFLQRMKNALNQLEMLKNREILMSYFESAEKGKDMEFDKMFFLKKQNWIIEQVQEQKKTLREIDVTVDEQQLGIQKILPQTLAYLEKSAQGYYPLTFQKKLIEDGSEYIGFLSKGVRTIFGMRRYKNGFIYYGEWRINAKNGWGVYENKTTGYRYAGCWKQDKKNGFGRQETVTNIYEGNFVGDKKQGFGVLIEEGTRYEITWKNDKRHGSGKRIQKNGQQFQIYYLNGIQSTPKFNKISPAFDLKELTKRFSTKSVVEGAKST